MGMSLIMVVHAIVGIAVVVSGATALFSSKGSALHRFGGRCFVGLMICMGFIVAASALLTPGTISALGILFVIFINYLVLTSLHTVKRSISRLDFGDYLAPVVALCIFCAGLLLGLDAIDNPIEGTDIPPVEAYFFFAIFALFAMLLDINHLRLGGVRGKHRLLRHLWRMSCALFFSTSTLFTGPGSMLFPESIYNSTVFSIPQTLVIVISVYWIYKVFHMVGAGQSEKLTNSAIANNL